MQTLANPGKYSLIESEISHGRHHTLVTTVMNGIFWENGDADSFSGGEAYEDSDGEVVPDIDEVDLAMGRMALNGFLKSIGEPPAF